MAIKWQTALKLLSGGSISVIALFSVLFLLAGVEYEHSGDITCTDTCESYINVSTRYWRICFENSGNEDILYKKQTRSRTLWVNLDKVDNIISTEPKIEVDWLVPTYGRKWRPVREGDCWDRGKINKIKLVGHKEPDMVVKWSFVIGDKVDIDPLWDSANVTLDGLNEDRKYEYGSTANITAIWNETVCLDFDAPGYNVSYVCGNPVNISYVVGDSRSTIYDNTTITFGAKTSQLTNFSVGYNDTQITQLYWNLSGGQVGGSYPTNLQCDYFDDGSIDLTFIGNLTGNTLHQSYFSNDKNTETLMFASAGTISRLMNLSLADINHLTVENGTMNFTGGASNPEGIDVTEYFWNDSYTNYTLSTVNQEWKYENFSLGDISGRWSGTYSISTGVQISDTQTTSSTSCGSTNTGTNSFYSNTVALEDSSSTWIEVYIGASYCAQHTSTATCGGASNCGFGSATFRIKDKTTGTKTTVHSISGGCCQTVLGGCSGGPGDTSVWEIRKIPGNKLQFYNDGVYDDEMAYDPTHQYELYTENYATTTNGLCSGCGACGSNVGAQGNSAAYIHYINKSGITGQMIGDLTWGNGTYTNQIIGNFSSNITSARLTATERKPTGTSIWYYLSADGGLTWESVTNGLNHVFTIGGQDLMFRVNVSGTYTQDSAGDLSEQAIVDDVQVEVVSGYPENITIDIGGDGTYEWNNSGDGSLYSNQSIIANWSGTSIQTYIDTSCTGSLSCLIPIDIATEAAGAIEWNLLDQNMTINFIDVATITPNDLNNFTNYIAGNNQSIPMSCYSPTDGTVSFSDLDLRYIGESNFTILAHEDGGYTRNISRVISIRFSNYTNTYPPGVDVWEIIPSSLTQYNITPYKQYINTTNGTNYWEGSMPIFNITSYARTDALDLYVRLNESINACVNITLANSVIKNNGFVINTTDQKILTALSVGNTTGIYMTVDLSCKGVGLRYLDPYIIFNAVCKDCVYPTLSD